MSDESIWSRTFMQLEAWIKFLSGNRASSARQASFEALQFTPRVSSMNFRWSFSKGSDKVCHLLATSRWFSLSVLMFPPPIKLTCQIYNVVEIYNHNPIQIVIICFQNLMLEFAHMLDIVIDNILVVWWLCLTVCIIEWDFIVFSSCHFDFKFV